MIGRDADVRRARLEQLQHGVQHARRGAEPLVVAPAAAAPAVEVAEELVRPVDEVDDHREPRMAHRAHRVAIDRLRPPGPRDALVALVNRMVDNRSRRDSAKEVEDVTDAHRTPEGRAGAPPAPRRLAPTIAIALLAVAVTASAAGAAPASRSRGAAPASLCGVSRNVAKSIVRSTSSLAPSSANSPSALKARYTAVTRAEPALLAAARGSTKTDLKKALVFVNLLTAKLQKVGWNLVGLAPSATVLEASAQRAGPSIQRLEKYYSKTCKLKV